MQSVKTVAELRREGYKVRVKHHRKFIVGIPVENSLYPDNVLTRFEFEEAETLESIPEVDGAELPEMLDYSNCVLPHGGFTNVEVTTPEGVTSTGKYNFNNRQFNRKQGLVAALNRALFNLQK